MGNTQVVQKTSKQKVIKYQIKATGKVISLDLNQELKELQNHKIPPKEQIQREFNQLINKIVLNDKLKQLIARLNEKEKYNILVRHINYQKEEKRKNQLKLEKI